MANTYCHEEYCETTEKESKNTEISDKVIIGGYALVMIALGAVILYGVSMGFYIDPAYLN